MNARKGLLAVIRRSGIKRRTIAREAGLSEQQLCDILHERRKLDADELFRICRAIGARPDEVLTEAL